MSLVVRKLGKGRSGQAMVEFALVLPIFLLLVIGVLEFGRAWSLQSTLTEAAREGARRGAVYDPQLSTTAVTTAVKAKLKSAGFDSAQATVVWQDCSSTCTTITDLRTIGRGGVLNVRVSMPYRFAFLSRLMTLVNTSSNGALTLSTSTQMRHE